MNNLITEEDMTKDKIIIDKEKENVNKNIKKVKPDFKKDLSSLINKCNFILEVLDARDPASYRSKELENNVSAHKDKRIILILNKVDLISKETLEKNSTILRKSYPTIMFSTKNQTIQANSIKELTNLIKTMASQLPPSNNLTNNKKIYIGIVGYPNTGKASIVNSLKSSSTHSTHSSTENQEIILDYNYHLIEQTGVIFSKSEIGTLMPKCSKSADDIKEPLHIIKEVLKVIEHDKLLETYEIADFNDENEFLQNIAKHYNFNVKKGFCDVERAAKFVIQTIMDGKLRYEISME